LSLQIWCLTAVDVVCRCGPGSRRLCSHAVGARRLNALVKAGLLERRRYSEHPPRHEYVPTACGRDFRPVLLALLAWGNRHFAPEGASVVLVDRRSGRVVCIAAGR
jgi:DNA-binding HxlR family transcriptional regulator